jgi:hypothetical protein
MAKILFVLLASMSIVSKECNCSDPCRGRKGYPSKGSPDYAEKKCPKDHYVIARYICDQDHIHTDTIHKTTYSFSH